MAVRSRRFFGPTTLGTVGAALYTCPAGRTAIIRTLSIYNRAGAAVLYLVTLNGSTSADVVFNGTLLTQTGHLVHTHIVLNPGDVLRGHATAANAAGVSGFGSLLFGEPE